MFIGCWNVRGAGSRKSLLDMQDFKKGNKLDIMVICEPRISSDRARKVISQLGFSNAEVSDAVGFSGGIWVLWDEHKCNIKVIKCLDQSVTMFIETREGSAWLFTAVYGNPCPSRRVNLWNALDTIASAWKLPWLLAGDFNDILYAQEKYGTTLGRSKGFKDWFDNQGMIDLGFIGPRFSWVNKREAGKFVMKRLDRAICNKEWRILFPEAFVRHLVRRNSDHNPLLISLSSDKIPSSNLKPFRFEAMWLKHNQFDTFIQHEWANAAGEAHDKLNILSPVLLQWNKDVFGQLSHRKRNISARLRGIESALCRHYCHSLIVLEKDLQMEYDAILEQEDILWRQKSRISWLQNGDRNTKFFHLTTLVRRRRNRVERLKDDTGNWVTESNALRKLAVGYFQELFDNKDLHGFSGFLPNLFPQIDNNLIIEACTDVSPEDVKEAMFNIGPLKSPGPDGFPAIFFHNCWNTVKEDVTQLVIMCFLTGSIPEGLNSTLITLIPKVPCPQTMMQFRPISLCNSLYKVVSKIIVSKMRPLLCHLISPNQVSFAPGRQISENIFIAQEVLHRFRRAKGKKGFIAWKIDLSKAYDRLSWDFIEKTLREVGVGGHYLQLIMSCVTSVEYKIIMNGELTEAFYPKRGLRQGDPLSPYLFVLCMEKLSHIISSRVSSKDWKAVRAAKSGPPISHLFFADDLILFGEASERQAEIMKECLDAFCCASGQQVNFEKSMLFVSKNTKREVASEIAKICGSHLSPDLGKYLGVPLIQGRVSRNTYKEVVDKVQTRLSSWKSNLLSMAGKLTLIQSVTSTIPYYTMQTVRLPASVCADLDKANRNFLWGSTVTARKVHLVNWNVVCKPKRFGGLGIKRSTSMNQALLAKTSWRIANNHDGLWADMMRKKYLMGTTSFENYNVNSNCASSTWKGILFGAEILSAGRKWRVGNGKRIKFWTDPWVLEGSLIDSSPISNEEIDVYEVVANYFTQSGWNIPKLLEVLHVDVVQRIINTPADFDGASLDTLVWGPSSNGEFTVKSAYNICSSLSQGGDDSWYFIWKLKIPPKLKVFLWLLSQNKILTNVQRTRRKLTNNSACPFCHCQVESLQHVFIRCPRAQAIWNSFSLPDCVKVSLSTDFNCWLRLNLKTAVVNSFTLRWCNIFATGCWFIWIWRCCSVFDSSFHYPDLPNEWILRFLVEWDIANKKDGVQRIRMQTLLAWKPPPVSFMKLNIDGSRIGPSGAIAAGGIIRNSAGEWVAGFSANLGHGEILVAELWALYHGLKLAQRLQVTKLIVETDSTIVLHLLNAKLEPNHPLLTLLNMCKVCWKSSWDCSVFHVFREVNFAADSLAKMGHEMEMGIHCFVLPPGGITGVLQEDRDGLLRSRLIYV